MSKPSSALSIENMKRKRSSERAYSQKVSPRHIDLIKMNTMDKFAAKLNKATPKSASSSFWLQPVPNGRRTPLDWNKVGKRAAEIL